MLASSPTIPADLAGAVLSIDLGALAANWRLLKDLAGTPRCGAAVKGNGYGLGIEPVAQTLWSAGCRDFFVARPMEGGELRSLLPEAEIYVLDGLFDGQAEYYAVNRLIPGLISLDEARQWAAFGRVFGHRLPCAIHIDTGINRLGFSFSEFEALLAERRTHEALDIRLVMSHLACADEPDHPLNAKQRDAFRYVRQKLPGVSASLANSSGMFLGRDYLHDLPRPGIALYGGNPTPGKPNPMQPVAHLEGAIMQLRDVKEGETVGYSATWKAERASRIAVLGAGYKDGVPRALSCGNREGGPRVWLAGHYCPIIGRISMDMMAIDVTDVPEALAQRGSRAELLGRHVPIDEAAAHAGTISYELLTRLGSRYARLYSAPDSESPA
jgi:alanine racemase